MIPTVNQYSPTQHDVINGAMIPTVNQYLPTQHDVINVTMIATVIHINEAKRPYQR